MSEAHSSDSVTESRLVPLTNEVLARMGVHVARQPQTAALPMEVQAELAELREANRMTPDHLALAKFYGVTTYAGLVARQAHHIERLQAKLPQTPNVFAPQRVREG
jgi:ubiquinone biosynthesis protein UbiJ